jgi:hypothetical protein
MRNNTELDTLILDRLRESIEAPVLPGTPHTAAALSRRRRNRWIATTATCAVVCFASIARLQALSWVEDDTVEPTTASGGCGPFTGQITESNQFVSVDNTRGPFNPNHPIATDGSPSPVPPDLSIPMIGGLARQWAVTDGSGGYTQYYFYEPLDRIGPESFQAQGGTSLDIVPAASGADYASKVLAREGSRATPVQVGEATAAVVWADPEYTDTVRSHLVIWQLDGYVYTLTVVQNPEDAVTLARNVACR